MFLFLLVLVIFLLILCSKVSKKPVLMSHPLSAGTSNIGQTNNVEFEYVQCVLCSQPRYFKGQHGLNVHIGKAHKNRSNDGPSTLSAPPPLHFSHTPPQQPFWLALSNLKLSISVVKRIPRGARFTVAQNLSNRIKKVVNENSEHAWEQLLTFSFQVLHAKNTEKSLTSSIKNNCNNLTNSLSNLNSQCSYNFINTALNNHNYSTSYNIFQKVESKVSDGDLKGAAQLLFTSDVIAPDTPETLAALIDKHPPSLTPILSSPLPSLSSVEPLHVTEREIKAAVMSFKNGSAGGIDALSPQHLKDLIFGGTGDTGQALLQDLTALINLMISGKVNSKITPLLYGANLCALKKKDGGIRPIAVGCTYRRIASKVCCKKIFSKLTDTFQPLQLGFGSKGGCEAAVHALRSFITHNGGEVLLKVDVKNAFNCVDRATLLAEIQNHIPEIYNYLWQCYGLDSKLLYRNHLINSCSGCQQGDPLGPAIFSLAIQPIILSLNSKLNLWYLDDGSLGGDVNTVFQDLENLINKFGSIGLDLNFSKCELFITDLVPSDKRDQIINKFNSLAPNIKILSNESLRLLGAPILKDSFLVYINEQCSKFEEVSDRLLKIHSHIAFHIIRFCLFIPKLTYVLRCCPLWDQSALLTLDEIVRNILTQILNCSLSDKSWCQASLPIRFGGIGIRKISSVALPAFLSSVHSTAALCTKIVSESIGKVPAFCLDEASIAWSTACPGEDLPISLRSQRQWDEPLCRNVQKSLLADSNTSERARLLAASARESGYWLHAIPSTNIGTLLDNASFSIAVGLRLGISRTEPHLCHCGIEVDRLGHHGLSCRRSAGRFSRHAALNDVIRRALTTVNVPAILEPNGISRDDGKRPDGMTLIPWSRGRPLVWDATCVDTLAPSHVVNTARAAGAAAEAAESIKRRKYISLGEGYIFVPFGVETMGPWGPQARLLVKELSKRLTDLTRDQKAGTYLSQRISLAIQRGNVASFLGTLPADGDLNSVFYL